MNRKLLALAVGAALTLPLAAQAAPTVYGQLNLSVDKVNNETTTGGVTATNADQWEVNSNTSRIGLRGEEDLGNGFSAVYQAEWGVDASGDGGDLGLRDRFLGLKGGFGTVKLGAYDSPLRKSQGLVDQFNDSTYLDMGNFMQSGESFITNAIGYESPRIADAVTVSVVFQPGENTAAPPANSSDGLMDVISASVAYEAAGLYLALGYEQGDGTNPGAASGFDTMRLTGTYTMEGMQFGAMFQTSELSDPVGAAKSDEQVILLSASVAMGQGAIRGQILKATLDVGTPDDQETTVAAIGYDYNFTQMTKGYAQLGFAKMDNVGGAANTEGEASVFTVGMQTKF